MALQGNYTHTYQDTEDTESISVLVEYSETMEVDDPNYSKRGTSETLIQNVPKQKTSNFPNAYIMVPSVNLTSKIVDGVKSYDAIIEYRVYSSEDSRNTNIESYEYSDLVIISDIGDLKNPFIIAYEQLKTLDQFSNLTDV